MVTQELIAGILLWITVNTPYSMPPILPEVMTLPQQDIEEMICEGSCPVLAAYIPDKGVVLSDQLNPRNNICDRSILLHELIHFFQYDARGTMPSDRESWALREREAYQYQNRFLDQNAQRTPGPAPRDVRQCRRQQRQKMRQDFLNQRSFINQRRQHSGPPPGQEKPAGPAP